MAKQDIVRITCYGTTKEYDRQQAINKFLECMMMSEGSERDRYTNIYIALMAGDKIINGDR